MGPSLLSDGDQQVQLTDAKGIRMLQWGRRFSATEIRLAHGRAAHAGRFNGAVASQRRRYGSRTAAPLMPAASMGPSLLSDGDLPNLLGDRDHPLVASMGP